MADWVKKLDAFLQFNERNILTHAGKVSKAIAEEHAHREFAKHEEARRLREATEPVSDFDRVVEDVKRLESAPKPKTPAAKKTSKKAAPKKRGRRDV
jgi:hypothetical protein